MRTVEILRKAAKIVETRGLIAGIQEEIRSGVGARVCVLGALSIARYGKPYLTQYKDPEVKKLCLHLGSDYHDVIDLAGWSNNIARCYDQQAATKKVVAALRAAAKESR